MTDPTVRVPDPGLDDDPRIQAAVRAFAEHELAGVRFEPVSPEAPARRRSPVPLAIALAGVAVAGVLITPLAANRLTPAPIPAAPVVGLQQCLATLTADDILPGNRQVATHGLRIVASVATRYVDGQPRSSTSLVGNVDVHVTDDSTGETVLVDAPVSQLLWQAALPGNEAGDFLRHAQLEKWIRGATVEPEGNPTLVGATVFQQADMTITLGVRCGDSVRRLTVTGTGNPSLPGEATAMVTWLECGPDARNSGLSDELAVFAESCDTTLGWPPVKR